MLILWSIPVLTLYSLFLHYSSSSSSGREDRYLYNMSIFCTSEQATSFLVDGKFNGLNEAFSGRRCQQMRSMTNCPELSKSCWQGSLMCAACLEGTKGVVDSEDKLIGSIFMYPMKDDYNGHRPTREMYAVKGGGIHWVQMGFPSSLREVAPNDGRSNSLLENKAEEVEKDAGGGHNKREAEEKVLCLRLDKMLDEVRLVASDDVLLPRTLTAEVVDLLEKYYFASSGTPAQLGMSRKAPRRVAKQISESLLNLFPRKTFSKFNSYSSCNKIIGSEADVGEKHNLSSVSTSVENLVTHSRTRQLMQVDPNNPTPNLFPLPPSPPTPPPVPPPVPGENPNPYGALGPGMNDNSTYDKISLVPIINGPTEVTIQNVSIYLTGMLFNNYSIEQPPANSGGNASSNASDYVVVLQVDSGSMLIYLPPELLPSVKHQVSVGNFWLAVPEEDWNVNAYAWVPGAGIQFQCSLDVCNSGLKTLSYGKGLGTGKKSRTIFTILIYPVVNGESIIVAKAMKSCIMEIAGAGAWFTIFQYTKLFYTTSLGVLGMGLAFLITLCCMLCCCVCWQNRKQKRFNKRQVIVKIEDALYDETRVFNPFWIPSATIKAGENKFIVTPNPKFLQQLQSEHLTRIQSIGKDGTLDAMQFLAAAQAAAATTSSDVNFTTSEDESALATETETTVTGGSSFGSRQSSGSSRSSHTSGTSRTSKSTRFSLKDDSGTPADTDESAEGESDDSEES